MTLCLLLDIFYLIGILGSSTFNFHLVNRMLITCESSIGVFLQGVRHILLDICKYLMMQS
jgi:hypothetical protein